MRGAENRTRHTNEVLHTMNNRFIGLGGRNGTPAEPVGTISFVSSKKEVDDRIHVLKDALRQEENPMPRNEYVAEVTYARSVAAKMQKAGEIVNLKDKKKSKKPVDDTPIPVGEYGMKDDKKTVDARIHELKKSFQGKKIKRKDYLAERKWLSYVAKKQNIAGRSPVTETRSAQNKTFLKEQRSRDLQLS
jgi:hypothetical protein